MTSRIATIANLALHTFQQHSLRTAASSNSNPIPMTKSGEVSSNGDENCMEDPSCHLPYPDSSLISTESLQKLMDAMRAVTPKDVGFDARWISASNVYAAPVAYVHITENETFSMGMFILRPGSRIPLHDHPGMFGVLRVVHGSVRCRSFSKLQNVKPPHQNLRKSTFSKSSDCQWQFSDLIIARPHQDIVLTFESVPLVLGPNCGNLHEITPVDSPAVFLDILAPPYDHDLGTRECHFYKEVTIPSVFPPSYNPTQLNGALTPPFTVPTVPQESDINSQSSDTGLFDRTNGSSVIYLVETNQPKDYWCESTEYMGPKVT